LKGSQAEVKTYALKLLSYRSRSRREMLERLTGKGFDNGLINETIKSLEDSGLINDSVLASELFRHSTERKPLGKKGIRMFLFRRGIDKELIDEILLTHTSEMEEKAAREFVERKLKTMKNYPENIVRRRLWGMLRRRGFSTHTINRVINSIKV
jgi:regulatory protein